LLIIDRRGVRISPHFYTKDEELGMIVAEMKTIRDTGAFAAAKNRRCFLKLGVPLLAPPQGGTQTTNFEQKHHEAILDSSTYYKHRHGV